jgi:hypothetical protein
MDTEAVTPPVQFDVSMSPAIGKIAAALAKAQAVMGPAIKDKEGIIPGKDGRQGYRYGYATLAACFGALQPLYDNGIAVTQIPLDGGNGVRVLTYLLHESGEWIRGELWMPVGQQTPQGVGSALTYARRYGLSALTGLASDDDDGSVATHGNKAEPAQPIQKPQVAKTQAPPKAKPAPVNPPTDAEWDAADRVEPAQPTVHSDLAESLFGAVGETDTFPGLHKLVMEAQNVPEAARRELFEALTNRGILLFAEAKSLEAVKAGFPVVTQLGQPVSLREAANAAHLRFRNNGAR